MESRSHSEKANRRLANPPFSVDEVRSSYVGAHFTRIFPRLIFSCRVPYICLSSGCANSLFCEILSGPSTGRPRDRFYHATVVAPLYYRERISEAIHARKVVVSGQRAYSISPSPVFMLSSPRHASPRFPFGFHSRRLRQTSVASGNIRQRVLSRRFHSGDVSHLYRAPSSPSLIARKYTVAEQFGPAVESVLWGFQDERRPFGVTRSELRSKPSYQWPLVQSAIFGSLGQTK